MFSKLFEKIRDYIREAKEKNSKKLIITSIIIFFLIYRLIFSDGIGIFDKKYELDQYNKSDNYEYISGDDKEQSKRGDEDKMNKYGKVSDKQGKITVYITGAVANPGVIKVDQTARLDDAIKFTGGLLKEADTNRINLAMTLEDSQHYIIPYKGDEKEEEKFQNQSQIAQNNEAQGIVNQSASNQSQGSKININTASESELENIPGVGPATAKKIIDYRNKSGKFSSIEDIKNVSGIGDKKFENMKDSICI